MRTRATRCDLLYSRLLFLLLLCHAGFAASQPLPTPFADERPPVLVMVARDDPAYPERYIGVFGLDLSEAVAIYQDGRRVRTTVPHVLQRGDEIETDANVIAVIRYPAGDVYMGAATRARIGSLDVLFGKVFARVRGLFSVENQNVVAGVEGTEFAFEAADDGTVNVTVLDGTVRCSSKTLTWNPVRLGRGQSLVANGSNREPRVGPANPAELAQLRSWIRRVDNAVAPPTTPQPVEPPQPIPVQPSPPSAQWGYCCEQGNVFRTVLEGCRGGFYSTQAEAYQRCRSVTTGFCCENGRVFPSAPQECPGIFSFDQAGARASCAPPPLPPPPLQPPQWQLPLPPPRAQPQSPPTLGFCCSDGEVTETTRDRCRGSFYFDQPSARRSCASPPPQPSSGYCCANGQVTQAMRNQCRGNFFNDEASARKSCVPPPQLGYCCAAGEISRANRAQCRGSFFTDEASARKSCVAPPEQGYCCAGGKVSETTRDRCSGTFFHAHDEAQRACRRQSEILIDKGVVTTPPRNDTPR